MAIRILKGINPERLIFAFNNNIIRFDSDSGLVPETAEIGGLDVGIILYPHPDGSFYFNFKDYMSSIINTDNFKDDMVIPNGVWFYNWTSKIYLQNAITLKINFSDTTSETHVLNIQWLSAYMQLDEYKKTYPLNDIMDFFILTPQKIGDTPVLKYWEGYPFDFTIYTPNSDDITIYSISTDNKYVLDYTHGIINRVLISNGSIEIPDMIRLGFNQLDIYTGGTYIFLTIRKLIPICNNEKHYIKWINRYGGWNYWLFNHGKKTLNPKGLGVINNDFSNLEDTLSPIENIGVTSFKSILLIDDISDEDMVMLFDLFESPKIYLFTGEPNSVSTYHDWIEVNIKDKAVKIKDVKYNYVNVQIEIDLPTRITRIL